MFAYDSNPDNRCIDLPHGSSTHNVVYLLHTTTEIFRCGIETFPANPSQCPTVPTIGSIQIRAESPRNTRDTGQHRGSIHNQVSPRASVLGAVKNSIYRMLLHTINKYPYKNLAAVQKLKCIHWN